MRNLLLSTITLLIFSVALTACGGGGGTAGTDPAPTDPALTDPALTDPAPTNPDPTNPVVVECPEDINKCADSEEIFNIRNLSTIEAKNQPTIDWDKYDSLDAVSADADATKSVTLAGLGLSLNQTDYHTRAGTNIDWKDGADAKGITVEQRIRLSRITSPTVTLTFDSTGAISGVKASYGSDEYMSTPDATATNTATSFNGTYRADSLSLNVAVDRKIIFGFDSAYMAYIKWDAKQEADFTVSTATTANAYDIKGALLTGFETTDFTAIASKQAMFKGAGKGVYGVLGANNALTTYNTSFTATVAVDFGTNMVTLNSSAPSCVATAGLGDCNDSAITNAFAKLNVVGASTKLIDGKIDNVFIVADTMSGRLDARFYGGEAQEFGGTFALTEANKRYYYGAFGAKRGDFFASVTSFDDFSDVTADGKSAKTISFSSIAVEGSVTATLTRDSAESGAWWDTDIAKINATNISAEKSEFTSPQLSLTYADESISAATITLGGQSYMLTADNGGASTNLIRRATLRDSNNAFNVGYVEISRGQEFGFDSKYMLSARWATLSDITLGGNALTNNDTEDLKEQKKQTSGTGTVTAGYLVSGFETGGTLPTVNGLAFTQTAIPTQNEASFTGKGSGYYLTGTATDPLTVADAIRQVEFDIDAIVDFSTRNVSLTAHNTASYQCADANSAFAIVTQCNSRNNLATRTSLAKLNFNTLISYKAGENSISNSLTVDGMAGTIDARFYGIGDSDVAREFGGTFALADSDANAHRYYYGVFGAQRGDIAPFTTTGTVDVASEVSTMNAAASTPNSIHSYDSLDTFASTASADPITLQGLAVLIQDGNIYRRQNTTVGWGETEKLQISRQSILARIASPLAAAQLTSDGTNISATMVYADTAYANPTIDRSDIFGFDSESMAYISWGVDAAALDMDNLTLTQSAMTVNGAMITGIETAGANIPDTADFGFAGKGKGIYVSGAGNRNTDFDMIAVVDVTNREIALTASNTVCPAYDCGINANHLDFSGTLNYGYDATNMVALNDATGDVTGGSGLTGKADARFYGSVAQEFGGTFLLANANSYYYGGFGGQPNHVLNYNLDKNIVDSSATGPALNYQTNIDSPSDVNIPALATDEKGDGTTYKSIDDLFKDGPNLGLGDTKNLTLPAFGHHRYYQYSYQRNDTSIAWEDSNISHDVTIVRNLDSVVSLNFYVGTKDSANRVFYQYGSDADGKKEGVTVYTGRFEDGNTPITVQYAGNTGTAGRTFFRGETINIDPTYTSQVRTHRNDTGEEDDEELFGFMPKYLIGITWYKYFKNGFFDDGNSVEANGDIVYGRMIAGFETGKAFVFDDPNNPKVIGSIPTDASANATFTGKGSGSYGYKKPIVNSTNYISKRETIVFNVAANVDFANRNIDFSIYNNCYYDTCRIKREGLDFNANISFDDNGSAVNNISAPVTTDNGLLKGTLDARFYGDMAQEIGGSFTMIGVTDDIYYFGTFATSSANFDGTQDKFSVNTIPFNQNLEVYYEFSEATNIPYASFAKAVGANESSRFVVRGSAVQKHDVTDYVRNGKAVDWNGDVEADIEQNIVAVSDVSEVRDISIVGSKTPAVALDFDADGKIAAIEAYFGFNSYTATLADGATGITANGTITNAEYADAQTSNISADRSAFGFTSDYMVYVDWSFVKTDLDATNSVIADDIYNIGGMMVAGLETQTMPTTMPENSQFINFVGAGTGNYGDETADHAVSFKTYAEVNFTNRTVAFATHKTACVVNACTLDDDTLNTLNFTRSLKYSAGVNRAGQTIRVASSLVGPFYARFYGVGDDSATEFGGTFGVRDSSRYYYGAFGAYKGGTVTTSLVLGSINDITIDTPESVVIPTDVDGTTYVAFRDAIIDENNPDGKLFTLHGVAAYGGNNIDYNRTKGQKWREMDGISSPFVTRLVGASASITVTSKQISDLTLHLDDKNYSVDAGGAPSSGKFSHKINDADGTTGTLVADRRSAIFGFTPYNILYVHWELKNNALADDTAILSDNTYTSRGMMLVGIESEVAQIPTINFPALDSLVNFSGKGRGYYNVASEVRIARFSIAANVDFLNKTVSLSTGNNNSCSLSFQDCENDTTLNFTTATPLSYDGSNGISGAIESKTYGENSELAVGSFTGTVDASFYGATANEFGGTFTMSNDNNGYFYGMFGTKTNDNPFDYADDKYDTGSVARVRAANPVVDPNHGSAYVIHDSFLDAHQNAKAGPIQTYGASTPALVAYREDTIRHVRTTADATAPRTWENSEILDKTIVVANIDNSSSYIVYNGPNSTNVPGSIQSVRAFAHKVSYVVQDGPGQNANTRSLHDVKTDFTVDPLDYHYASGGDSLDYYEGSGVQLKNFHSTTKGNLTVEKPTTFIFQAKYMAYIRWTYTKTFPTLGNNSYGTGSDVDGYMVTGFETGDNTNPNANDGNSSDDLPKTGTASFVGGGMGTYHHASGQGYRTRFDANADVDFAAGTIDLILNNTRCVAGLGDCDADIATITPELLENLDITNAALSFDKGVNDMTAIAIDTDGGMNGQIDARFYGQNRKGANNQNAAKEFGGAFSFRDGDKSYIGIFGTERGAITPPTP